MRGYRRDNSLRQKDKDAQFWLQNQGMFVEVLEEGRFVVRDNANNPLSLRVEESPKKTALYDQNAELTDKSHLVPFAGYLMPLWYSSIAAEHAAVRSAAGRGFHPPTVYFPTIVKEAMMFEPTETESKETLDRFVDAMMEIAEQAENEPEKLQAAPTTAVVCRPNETVAAKELNIACL